MMRLRAVFCACILSLLSSELLSAQQVTKTPLCLDGVCIGQSINDPNFDQIKWIIPKEGVTKQACAGIGCKPQIAFHGYSSEDQKQLAEALSWNYGLTRYNIITKTNLGILRRYKYECNPSPRGIDAERRFFGAYLSSRRQYLTIVGLRLIGGELKVYRIARQYRYRNQTELISLGKKLREEYGDAILVYNYLSSNAYSDVIEQKKKGWFGRSTMFNQTNLADNAAEFVLIDPRTRHLLESTSIPESGDIKPLAAKTPNQCSTSLSIR